MTSSNQSTSIKPQNFTIDGIKFFKAHLDKLRLDSTSTENPVTTSEVSLFMILHLYTDEMGQIRSFTKDPSISERKQLCISNISTDHDLTYETVKKAFDTLISKNYVKEVYTETGVHYEIVDYALYNQQLENNKGLFEKGKSSYFRIPKALFLEKIFGSLIKHRYHTGPIFLLELCQYFTVQIGTNRKYTTDINKVTGERTMNFLKKTLRTNAKRVRQFLGLINRIFKFEPVNTKVKKPVNRFTRKRSFTQVCIDKFKFHLNGNCFKENELNLTTEAFSRSKKEIDARVKYAQIPLKWREMQDIYKSISRVVNLSQHLSIVQKEQKVLNFALSKVSDTLEELHKNDGLKTIKSVGAFVNKMFSNAFDEFVQNFIKVDERIDIMDAYHRKYGEYPLFINRE
ncbi:hypothetical protein [Bacillus stratosphericus]|uniref:hypothetical protein n=1 Tax=Bacillus stratosphericus TaxID=293386 RepID=UPI001CFACAC4|nr:hypothetical protein [Bacillus stratosphericus]